MIVGIVAANMRSRIDNATRFLAVFGHTQESYSHPQAEEEFDNIFSDNEQIMFRREIGEVFGGFSKLQSYLMFIIDFFLYCFS